MSDRFHRELASANAGHVDLLMVGRVVREQCPRCGVGLSDGQGGCSLGPWCATAAEAGDVAEETDRIATFPARPRSALFAGETRPAGA